MCSFESDYYPDYIVDVAFISMNDYNDHSVPVMNCVLLYFEEFDGVALCLRSDFVFQCALCCC